MASVFDRAFEMGLLNPVQLGVPRAAHFEVEPPANSP